MTASQMAAMLGSRRRPVVGAELESTTALRYLRKVDDDVMSLDADARQQKPPQQFMGPWIQFVDQDPAHPELPMGWKAFFRDSSSLLDRVTSTREVITRTGEFERRLIELHRKFVAEGGAPSRSEPVPGAPAVERTEPVEVQLQSMVKWALILAAVGVGAYVVLPVVMTAAATRKATGS